MRRSKPIARRTPLRPGAPPKRSGRITRKPRSASEYARIYGSRARVRFVTRLPCFACGYAGEYPRQNAHTQVDGMSRKAHYTTILPLCGPCHAKQDGVNGGWIAIGLTAESCRRGAELTESHWIAYLHRGGPDDEP